MEGVKEMKVMRLMSREAASVVYYRSTMKLSINKISVVMERSTRTIQKLLKKNAWVHKLFDQRHLPWHVKNTQRLNLRMLQWCLSAFLSGLRDDIEVLEGDKPP